MFLWFYESKQFCKCVGFFQICLAESRNSFSLCCQFKCFSQPLCMETIFFSSLYLVTPKEAFGSFCYAWKMAFECNNIKMTPCYLSRTWSPNRTHYFELWQASQGNASPIIGNQLHSSAVKIVCPPLHCNKLIQIAWEYVVLFYPLVMQRGMY